jgi:hypothetical protein
VKPRTDIYEHLAHYPTPPMVPFPVVDDLSVFDAFGLRFGRVSRRITKAALWLCGLRAFQRLPEAALDRVMRTTPTRALVGSPVHSASLLLIDDPEVQDPLTRAAALVCAAHQLLTDVSTGRLPPDLSNGAAHEMSQYLNLFGTTLRIVDRNVRIYKSRAYSHILVVHHGQLSRLKIADGNGEVSVSLVRHTLASLVESAAGRHSGAYPPSPTLFTSGPSAAQVELFSKLERDARNARTLAQVRETLLTLCLDLDRHPGDDAAALRASHTGNCANRWFHASLQIVVFGNTKAAMICNFNAHVDGSVMMRAAAEMHRRAVTVADRGRTAPSPAEPVDVCPLSWALDPADLVVAEQHLRAALDDQPATFDLAQFSLQTAARLGVRPVPTFVVALQMALRQLGAGTPDLLQLLTMSRYRCMGVASAVVTTPAVRALVEHLEIGRVDPTLTRALYEAAADSQAAQCRRARAHLPTCDMLALFIRSRSRWQHRRLRAALRVATAVLPRSDRPLPGPVAVVMSHPPLQPEVPYAGRPGIRLDYVGCFGLHYQIKSDRTSLTLMPARDWSIPNAELVRAIERALTTITAAILGGAPSPVAQERRPARAGSSAPGALPILP